MSYGDMIIFYITVFLCFFIEPFVDGDVMKAAGHANNAYARYVAVSCEDAMTQSGWSDIVLRDDTEAVDTDFLIWDDFSVRENAVSMFYKTFGSCLNRDDFFYEHELELMTPVLALVDYDGYYICHNGGLDSLTTTSPADESLHCISPLQAFSEERAGYQIRYYLSDTVEVYTGSGLRYKGHRRDVYDAIGDTALAYLVDDAEFDEIKTACIVGRINEQVLYYMNEQNYRIEDYDVKYFLGLSQVEGATFCGLLDKPAVLGFVQGNTFKTQGKRISVYGFAMSELGEPLHYFIVKNPYDKLVYYCYEEALVKGSLSVVDGQLTYYGQIIRGLYPTKKDCVKLGAVPGV